MTKRGRPKSGAQMSRETILATAFEVLDEAGHQGLSMRAVASRLNVTPMALYHHFADRSALVREMSDSIYAGVVKDFESCKGKARRRMEQLLTRYYQAVVRYPNLTVLIFATPDEFSIEVQQINHHLADLLGEADLTAAKAKLWLEILVDFTHGSAMATATAPLTGKDFTQRQESRYRQQLGELLGRIFLKSVRPT